MPETKQTRLVVVVPSITDRVEPWDGLVARLQSLPGYDEATCHWHRTHHGAKWRKPGNAADFGAQVAADINEQWVAHGGFESVVLVGHSFGGVMVRYAYLHALGSFDKSHARDWSQNVERIILFASLNRGIEVSFNRRWWLPLVAWLARVLPLTRRWLAHDLLRASSFITNLRIAWLRAINGLQRPPVMVQYLGRSDHLVNEDDSLDIDTFTTGTQEFIPHASHADLISLDSAPHPEARFALIAQGFTKTWPKSPPGTGDPTQRVVIVLHGIRANNDSWARELERHIESRWRGTEVIAATYGRFSARKFLLPMTRRKFLTWMQHAYAERLAANPKATFHFVGHSNGTYLLGHSLAKIPAMKFDRIALAGSVLPEEYDWGARLAAGQVNTLRNHRSAGDFSVGFLCSALRGLFMRDVGTAGVSGFLWESPAKSEVYYYPGGHGQALHSSYLPDLAEWVMAGTETTPADLITKPTPALSVFSRLAPHFARVVVLLGLITVAAFPALSPLTLPADLGILIGAALVLLTILDVV